MIIYHLGMLNHTFVPCIDNKRETTPKQRGKHDKLGWL